MTKNNNTTSDEQLSDFADRVIKGQTTPASGPTEEMRGLEETILRIHSAFPPTDLEEATKKQMLLRFNSRIRKENEKAKQKKTFWQSLFNVDWISPQSRPQFAVALTIIALFVVVAIVSPGLESPDSGSTVGTALSANSNILIVGILIAIVVGILWSTRRK